MKTTRKATDPLPGRTATVEQVAEFWDTHDTTDYPDAFHTVDVSFDIRKRHYEVEVQEDVFRALRQRSRAIKTPIGIVVDALLRKQFVHS